MRMWVAALAMSCALPAGVAGQGSYPFLNIVCLL